MANSSIDLKLFEGLHQVSNLEYFSALLFISILFYYESIRVETADVNTALSGQNERQLFILATGMIVSVSERDEVQIS